MLSFKCVDPANPRSNHHTTSVPVEVIKIQSGIFNRFRRRGQSKKLGAIKAACLLSVGGNTRIKVFNLTGDPSRECIGIKRRDRTGSRPPGEQSLPENIHRMADRSKNPHTGDNNPMHRPGSTMKTVACHVMYPNGFGCRSPDSTNSFFTSTLVDVINSRFDRPDFLCFVIGNLQ